MIAARHGREARGGARARRDDLVNYSTEKLTERVMALTDGKGADVCFDPVGGDLFDAALSALGWERPHPGRRVRGRRSADSRIGSRQEPVGDGNLTALLPMARARLRASVDELLRWYEGKLKPCISHRLPLEKSVEAIRL